MMNTMDRVEAIIALLAGLGSSHSFTADLTVADNVLAGRIVVRPRRGRCGRGKDEATLPEPRPGETGGPGGRSKPRDTRGDAPARPAVDSVGDADGIDGGLSPDAELADRALRAMLRVGMDRNNALGLIQRMPRPGQSSGERYGWIIDACAIAATKAKPAGWAYTVISRNLGLSKKDLAQVKGVGNG